MPSLRLIRSWASCVGTSVSKLRETAYLSRVRPPLEYCGAIWDPSGKEEANSLEVIQWGAARWAHGTYGVVSVMALLLLVLTHSLLSRVGYLPSPRQKCAPYNHPRIASSEEASPLWLAHLQITHPYPDPVQNVQLKIIGIEFQLYREWLVHVLADDMFENFNLIRCTLKLYTTIKNPSYFFVVVPRGD